MITNITLENFKCLRQVSINPKLLTVLIGPNGTGKSSILQALLLQKQTVSKRSSIPLYRGDSIDLRGKLDVDPNFMDDPPGFFVGCDVGAGEDHYSLFQDLRFVASVRGLVKWTYPLGNNYVYQITLQQGFDEQERQLATKLVYKSESTADLSAKLKRITGTGLKADTVPPVAAEIKSLASGGAVNIAAEGFGTNSLILLLDQLVNASLGATVLIEEPEIHLHPKAQTELAEVLAETAKAEDKQIIMTTHSEHLVERLLLLVAEGTLAQDDLAIYSFSKDEKGECFASEIVVTENGQVEGGLTDFYANNLETLDRRVKALKRSQ